MKFLFFTIFTFLFIGMTNSVLIFDFGAKSDISDWKVVDDNVMGGRSNGNFYLSEQGNGIFDGIFEGKVSLENNGGFSSLRYIFDRKNIQGYTKINIHLKGDKKRYQFRLKTNQNDRHSYVSYFETSEEWEIITLYLADMIPNFRGQRLDLSNYQAEELAEIGFLIGNKEEQNFRLEINKVELIK